MVEEVYLCYYNYVIINMRKYIYIIIIYNLSSENDFHELLELSINPVWGAHTTCQVQYFPEYKSHFLSRNLL